VPAASEPSARPAQMDGSSPASQVILVAVKYGSSRSPVSSVTRASCPASRSASQIRAVRRSCQTMAGRGAARSARSQMTAVSRWLVRPTQVTPAAPSRAWRHAARVACQISSGTCSTQPGRG
jgi:hypothetical protein